MIWRINDAHSDKLLKFVRHNGKRELRGRMGFSKNVSSIRHADVIQFEYQMFDVATVLIHPFCRWYWLGLIMKLLILMCFVFMLFLVYFLCVCCFSLFFTAMFLNLLFYFVNFDHSINNNCAFLSRYVTFKRTLKILLVLLN